MHQFAKSQWNSGGNEDELEDSRSLAKARLSTFSVAYSTACSQAISPRLPLILVVKLSRVSIYCCFSKAWQGPNLDAWPNLRDPIAYDNAH